MAWTLTAEELAAAVAEARADAAERNDWMQLEMLARGLRWLDQAAESSRVFHDAAIDVIQRIEVQGRGDARSRARTAGLFMLAGDREPARRWGRRAAKELLRRRDAKGFRWLPEIVHDNASRAVDTLYASGEPEQALKLASNHGIDGTPAVDLLEAERGGDLARCDRVVARVAAWIVAERLKPTAFSGLWPLHHWDWLEAGFVVRAHIAGEPSPSHALMLERAGLLGPGASRRIVQPVAGGVDRFAVIAADGAQIEATIDRRDPSAVKITLDPREHGPYLALTVYWRDDVQSYGIWVWIEPQSSHQDALPYNGPDFREAVDAAADWLDGIDYHGRDGTWAARTLRELTTDLPLR
jgi:hypothetical protein